MPTERIPLQRPRRGHVTSAQWLELWLGPGATSVFTSREELEDAWQRVRERLMASLNPGRRAMAWWEFDTELRHPGYFREQSFLYEHNELSQQERALLERQWKAAFQEAQAPDFTLNDGGGELLKGDCARAAHYAWADIPRELVKRWEKAERRRRARGERQPVSSQEEAAAAK
jgi:hypothetical protein